MALQKDSFQIMAPLFFESLPKVSSIPVHRSHHLITLTPKCNGFIERQIKTIKTALPTANSSGKSLDELLLSLRSMPIGPHLPSPREILHNKTQD